MSDYLSNAQDGFKGFEASDINKSFNLDFDIRIEPEEEESEPLPKPKIADSNKKPSQSKVKCTGNDTKRSKRPLPSDKSRNLPTPAKKLGRKKASDPDAQMRRETTSAIKTIGTERSALSPIVEATLNIPFIKVCNFLGKYDISEEQIDIMRRVRRQAKNRIYAQKCRQRRSDRIRFLAYELGEIKEKKDEISQTRGQLLEEYNKYDNQYKNVYRYVFEQLKERRINELKDTKANREFKTDEEFDLYSLTLHEENESLFKKKNEMEDTYLEYHKYIIEELKKRRWNSSFGTEDNTNDSANENGDCEMNEVVLDNQMSKMDIAKEFEKLDNCCESSISEVDDNKSNTNENTDILEAKDNFIKTDPFSNIKLDDDNQFYFKTEPTIADSPRLSSGNMDENDDDSMISIVESVEIIEESPTSVKDTGDGEIVLCDTLIDNVDEISLVVDEQMMDFKVDVDDLDDWDGLDDEYDTNEELLETKASIQERYDKLYDYALKNSNMSETEFLKSFIDYYCMAMMKKK